MKLRTRLVLFGAVLPAVALAIAIVVAGWWLRRSEAADLDRHLLNQAAVESVGMFDGPGGTPHVHVERSPLASTVAAYTADVAVYAPSGERVTEPHDAAPIPRTLVTTGPVGVATLTTVDGPPRRVLTMRVAAPDHQIYTLWMGLPLASIDDIMARYYRATGTVLAVLALALLTVQLLVARRLTRRVDTMIRFAPKLRDGTGAAALPPDVVDDELGALREALRASADRVAAARAEQDRLLADAAHELRTPLTVIRTEVDLALRRERSADELKDALRSVRDDVDRLAKLAGALLDLQAVRHVGFEQRERDLVALVRDAGNAIRPLADARNITLELQLPPTAIARADELALRQAVDNLLANAMRYAPAGTAVEVSLARVGDGWRIAVADRGPGIPADKVEQVFEPFHRVGPSRGGGGLGLAIVREVMERHGGRWGVDLAHTPGARVWIELPALS